MAYRIKWFDLARSVSKSLAKTEIDTINLTIYFLPLAHHLANYIFSSSYFPFSPFPSYLIPSLCQTQEVCCRENSTTLVRSIKKKKIPEFLRKHHPFPFWNPCLPPKYLVVTKVLWGGMCVCVLVTQSCPILWGGMDTSICIAESLHCSPETMTTLLIGCPSIQNKKFFKNKQIKCFLKWTPKQIFSWQSSLSEPGWDSNILHFLIHFTPEIRPTRWKNQLSLAFF